VAVPDAATASGEDSDFWNSGLLVRPWRPSVTRSAWSRGGMIEGLRPRRSGAGGLHQCWNSCTGARSPREPGSAIVRGALRRWKGVPAQWRTRHARCGAGSAFCRGIADFAANGACLALIFLRGKWCLATHGKRDRKNKSVARFRSSSPTTDHRKGPRRALWDAMGAVPGTFSRQKGSQAPSPREID